MGMKLFSDGPSTVYVKLPNPDPHRFVVRVANQVGDYCVCLVHYPDCTTFKGNKIMVYRADARMLITSKELDPHFLETGLSPIARFPATDEGREDAFAFAGFKSAHATKG